MVLDSGEKNVRKQYSNVLWSESNNFWSKLNCYFVFSVESGTMKFRTNFFVFSTSGQKWKKKCDSNIFDQKWTHGTLLQIELPERAKVW